MRTKTTLSISSARKNIFSIAEEVQYPNVYYTLTERGKPKAVIVSAEQFEAILEKTEKNKNYSKNILRDKNDYLSYGSGQVNFFQKVLIVRDESKVVYVSQDQENLKRKEEELIKSQLYIQLIEKYKYPLDLVEVGRYVRIGGWESKRYIEADIIINEQNGNARIILETTGYDDYEANQDRIIADLFSLADALTWGRKPEFLIYYSRKFRQGIPREKIMVIDYIKYKSFSFWRKSGRLAEKEIPRF